MARDYKHRARQKNKATGLTQVAWWKWGLVALLLTLFIFFLLFLRNLEPENKQEPPKQPISTIEQVKKALKQTEHQQEKSPEPEFSFYTILPETEVVIPDFEIHTRVREEKLGKGKKASYLIQAGSFRGFAEADKLRAILALLGVESRIEKATIGNVVWNRVRMGPYDSPSSVSAIKKRLKQNGIDAKVTEIKE